MPSPQSNASPALEVGRQRGAREGGDIQTLVVAGDIVVRDRHVRRVGHHDPLRVGVLHGKATDDHMREAGVVEAVDIDAIQQARGIDDGVLGALAQKRERFSDDDVLVVRAAGDANHVIGSRGSHGGSDRRRTSTLAGSVDTQVGGSNARTSQDKQAGECEKAT